MQLKSYDNNEFSLFVDVSEKKSPFFILKYKPKYLCHGKYTQQNTNISVHVYV